MEWLNLRESNCNQMSIMNVFLHKAERNNINAKANKWLVDVCLRQLML